MAGLGLWTRRLCDWLILALRFENSRPSLFGGVKFSDLW